MRAPFYSFSTYSTILTPLSRTLCMSRIFTFCQIFNSFLYDILRILYFFSIYTLKKNFSITVYFQYYLVLISGVQHKQFYTFLLTLIMVLFFPIRFYLWRFRMLLYILFFNVIYPQYYLRQCIYIYFTYMPSNYLNVPCIKLVFCW